MQGKVVRIHPCNGIQVEFDKDVFWLDPELLIPLSES